MKTALLALAVACISFSAGSAQRRHERVRAWDREMYAEPGPAKAPHDDRPSPRSERAIPENANGS